MPDSYRIAIVGATSLRGKELNDALGESPFAASEIVLMDDESATGQLDTSGEEIAFIQKVEATSFERMDFVFFTSNEETTRRHWAAALQAGASVVDLTGAIESEPKVLVRAPWISEEINAASPAEAPDARTPDLRTPGVVPAHPAAVALGLLLARVKDAAAVRSAWATILEPASEHGRGAMDELHQQTVTLLSFQTLPRDIYDAQVAFNLLPVLGEAAKINLTATADRIRRHYALVSAGRLPEVGIQLIHVPVFHGYGISLGVELEQAATLEHLEAALSGDHVDVMLGDADAPSNLSSAGQDEILVRLRAEDAPQSRRFWIWASMDNLKIAAENALACALELRRLRPQGTVQ
ncbi:MAG TPA: Asd/ArgC dimerization domain-containing protein [Acidisarcina sp.]